MESHVAVQIIVLNCKKKRVCLILIFAKCIGQHENIEICLCKITLYSQHVKSAEISKLITLIVSQLQANTKCNLNNCFTSHLRSYIYTSELSKCSPCITSKHNNQTLQHYCHSSVYCQSDIKLWACSTSHLAGFNSWSLATVLLEVSNQQPTHCWCLK